MTLTQHSRSAAGKQCGFDAVRLCSERAKQTPVEWLISVKQDFARLRMTCAAHLLEKDVKVWHQQIQQVPKSAFGQCGLAVLREARPRGVC